MSTIKEWFDTRYVKDESGCWLWQGHLSNKGYGMVGQTALAVKQYGTRLAHRISYMLVHGKIPSSTAVMHVCDVPLCVNPEHLCSGTQLDNMRDMWRKNRGKRGDDHYNAKLNTEQVKWVKLKLSLGRSCRSLARTLGVSHQLISDIKQGKTWKHV